MTDVCFKYKQIILQNFRFYLEITGQLFSFLLITLQYEYFFYICTLRAFKLINRI